MGKKIKKLIGAAAPLAAFIPGVGLPLAAAIGAGGGLLSGGGLRGALAGGLGAAALGGGGRLLGTALGATGASGSALGSGLLGAAAGGASGGLRGAALGAAAGGLGGYAQGGGFDGLAGSIGDSLGNSAAGRALGFGQENAFNNIVNTPITSGAVAGAGAGGAASSYGGTATNLLSGVLGSSANDDAEDALLEQQRNNQQLYAPYLNQEFNPGDLQNDPGYQFQLNEGENALQRAQSARGNMFSGSALRAASDYNAGLAGTTYTNAYNRWLQGRNSNLTAAQLAAGVNTDIGNIRGNAIVNQGNLLSGTGAGLLGGTALNNVGTPMGGLTPEQLAALYGRNQSQYGA